jgi:protein-S-isoprenylcysteine O-methyltransferase Ste14
MQNFKQWASHRYSLGRRILFTLPAGALFVGLLPWLLIGPLPRLDGRLHLPALQFGAINLLPGGILILLGAIFAVLSNYQQFTRAQGTPLPMMATQKLLTGGIFSLCRNPMGFGTISIYTGIAFLVGSICSLAFAAIFAVLFICYIKFVEEKELALRFGMEYEAYKARTPFIFPRFFGQGWK